MRTLFVFLFSLFALVVILVTTNELSRSCTPKSNYTIYGNSTINSAERLPQQCSWACHNDTAHCQKNHLSWSQNYLSYLDPIYFGIIGILKSTGDYAGANVHFLVFLCPLIILFFLVKSWQVQLEINQLKKQR